MQHSIRHMLLGPGVFLFLAVAAACQGSSNGNRSNPPPQGGATGGNNTGDVNPASTGSKIKLDTPQELAKKTEVKAFHLLVRDGDRGYSGYCTASVKKPETLDESIEQVEIKEGPCPSSLKINGKNSPMVYACPAVLDTSGSKHQTFLYETMNSDVGFKKITELDFDISSVFCGT